MPPPPDDFTSQGTGSFWESESHVASDPSGAHVVAAWISIWPAFPSRIGYALSHDGGSTWTAPVDIIAAGGRAMSDPVVAMDSAGRAFLVWISFVLGPTGQPSDMHLEIASTAPAGDTFGTPVDVTGSRPGLDKPWMVVDGDDRVVAAWTNFIDYTLEWGRSDDHGATFTTGPLAAASAHFTTLCSEQVPGAPVYAAYADLDTAFDRLDILVQSSTDGGATWSAPVIASSGEGALPPTPTCAVQAQDVWIAYPRGMYAISYDAVRLVHSSDGGSTWGPPVTVNDDGSGQPIYLPQLAMSGSGRVEVSYIQGIIGQPTSVIHASTLDGASFQIETIEPDVGPFSYRRDTWPWYGDYVGLWAGPDWIYMTYAFAQEADQTVHTDFVRLPAP
jgi:hypothetical protein